jgi:pantoate--beta-alanine ligase
MQVVTTIAAMREACEAARAGGARVGLVPTMGALHRGHASLVEQAARRAGFVAVTVFVNPTQFGPNEDLARYPRTLDADVEIARAAGAALVFAPSAEEIYPPGDETRVRVGATATHLCGPHRPGHFEGVATVVAKLFAIAGPCLATFGRKDYQQLRVVARMITDLHLPVELVPVATEREPDGLALSSRNRYLSPSDRARALAIATGLGRAVRAFERGERRAGALRLLAREPVEAAFDAIDYVAVADPDTVVPHDDDATVEGRVLVATAARLGTTRLIDNVVLGEDAAPNGEG